MGEKEIELPGGNASGSVVRLGGTVRKPWIDNTSAVQGDLGVLRGHGVDAPERVGRDEHGRHVVEYVEGTLALDRMPLGREDLLRVGRMIRSIHDVSEAVPIPDPGGWTMLLPAENPNLMCHNDLAPWNLIWETAGSSSIGMVPGRAPGCGIWPTPRSRSACSSTGSRSNPLHETPRLRRRVGGGRRAARGVAGRHVRTDRGDVRTPALLQRERIPALGREVCEWARRALACRRRIRRPEPGRLERALKRPE